MANRVELKMPAKEMTGDDGGVRDLARFKCHRTQPLTLALSVQAKQVLAGSSCVDSVAVGWLIRQATALLRRCPGVGCRLNCLTGQWGERLLQC